jgi:hypothetical protein
VCLAKDPSFDTIGDALGLVEASREIKASQERILNSDTALQRMIIRAPLWTMWWVAVIHEGHGGRNTHSEMFAQLPNALF